MPIPKQKLNNKVLEDIRKKLVVLIEHNTEVPKYLRAKEASLPALKDGISYLIDFCELEKERRKEYESRVQEILDVTMALANLDYTKKASVNPNGNYIDALAAGINMLGEELKESTISLHEKETLLKEIHHRIKNNLQLVSSLLNLQSSFIADKAIAARLRESQDRIKSIALLHEKLYETKDLKRINFIEYVSVLVQTLQETYKDKKKHIILSMRMEMEDAFFTMDTALPCGLILNELVTNCYKYAFRKKKEGRILISMKKNKEVYTMVVSDNGSGIPKNIDHHTTASLGLQLVSALTEQLKGKIKIERKNGTAFTITFKPIH